MGRLVNAVKKFQNSWETSEVINIQKSCLKKIGVDFDLI